MSSIMPPIESRDPPALVLGGLSVWVLDQAFPESVEWYDGNWLQVRAEDAQ